MKQPKLYVVGGLEQLKRCILAVRSPKEFIKIEEAAEGVNGTLIVMNIILLMLFNMPYIREASPVNRVWGWEISVLAFMVYMTAVIVFIKGKVRVEKLVNIALYIHLIYIIINVSAHNTLPGIIVYVLGHIYTVILQVISLKYLFRGETERIKVIVCVETAVLILGLLNQLMIYIGQQMIYSSNLFHYQLLG